MSESHGKYIPALSYERLTPLYDPLIRLFMREARFKRQLVEQARIQTGQRILDLGCGTATLTILIKQTYPNTEVVGLDGDPKVLQIARAKVAQVGLDITLDEGMANDLPYPDGAFDRVVSSLVLHHLTRENKVRTAREAFRILRPGGELHVADFGKPHHPLMALISLVTRWSEQAYDNIKGRLPEMFRAAGFDPVEEPARYMTMFGTLSLYRARKPA